MPGMSKEAIRRMQERAAAIVDGGGNFQMLALSGKKAEVEPGGTLTIRLLPRWDYLSAFKKDKSGKLAENPDYEGGEILVETAEHWYNDAAGKRARDWCLAKANRDCPGCEYYHELMKGSEEDQKTAAQLKAKDVFLFNCVVRSDMYGDDERPKVRVLPANNSIFKALVRLIQDEEEGFARGDISDPRKGYDVKLVRPPADTQERWTVQCAAQPTPLVPAGHQEKWKGWPVLLVDLPEMLAKSMRPYTDVYKSMFGVAPETAPSGQRQQTAPTVKDEDEVPFDDGVPGVEGDAGEFDGVEFEQPPAQPQRPARAAQPPKAPPRRR